MVRHVPHKQVHRTDKIQYVYNIRIPAQARMQLLALMHSQYDPLRQKGKRFREAHDFTPVNEDLVIPEQIVYGYNLSEPYCVVCNQQIPQLKERCKFSIVNALNPDPTAEKCGSM
jgi:hypothetical protein